MVAVKVAMVPAEGDRRTSVWAGASLLASIGTTKSLWISREEYDMEGPTVCIKIKM